MANIIPISNVIPGGVGTIFPNAGVPSAGTTAIDTLTIGGTPTAGAGSSFVLAFQGYNTAPILWSATNTTLVSNIDAALEALPSVGTGGVTTAVATMTAGVGTITLTYAANLANLATGPFTVVSNSMTGTSPTIAIANTTPGVTATFRGLATGAIVSDTTSTSGELYMNTGTPNVPVFAKVGGQS